MSGTRARLRLMAAAVSLALLAVAAGCGGKTSRVTGKVHAGGKPVTGGLLVFTPALDEKRPGVPVSVRVKPDGTFDASKVVPGKATVNYTPPPDEWPAGVEPKASEPPPPGPWSGYAVKKKDVEIPAGSATLDIEVGPTVAPPPS